jgi:hypothetical protein
MSEISLAKKTRAILSQLKPLITKQFRITLIGRREGLRDRNFGNKSAKKRAITGEKERFYHPDDIVSLIPELENENMHGYEIYVTPISWSHHHLVVDDMTPEKYAGLLDAGYRPATVSQSSDGNFQCVLLTNKVATNSTEQSIGNDVMQIINRDFGDSNIVGTIHAFRLAGFANKKMGKGDPFTKLISINGGICAKADSMLDDLRENPTKRIKKITPRKVVATPEAEILLLDMIDAVTALKTAALAMFKTKWMEVERSANRFANVGQKIDRSIVDFKTCKHLKCAGFAVEQIAYALLNGSPDIRIRHPHVAVYVSDTARRS